MSPFKRVVKCCKTGTFSSMLFLECGHWIKAKGINVYAKARRCRRCEGRQ